MRLLLCLLFIPATNSFVHHLCPDGWEDWRLSCYQEFTKEPSIDFWSAEEHCNSFKGNLVNIRDKAETEFLVSTFRLKSNSTDWFDQAYIGLYRSSGKGEWQWTKSGTQGGFLDWAHNEPNNHNNIELCGLLITDSYDRKEAGKFLDAPCTDRIHRYICKKPIFGGN